MPHTKSAAKRLRSSEKRRVRNRTAMKGVKKQTRAVADALDGGDATAVATAMGAAAKKLDKAARLKSRMAKKLAALKTK